MFRNNNSDNSHVHQMLGEQYEQTDCSSSEDRINFPFLTTPSGNLKVVPQQVGTFHSTLNSLVLLTVTPSTIVVSFIFLYMKVASFLLLCPPSRA